MNNKKFVIYEHRNKINNKIYIGQTCQKPTYRWGSRGQGYKNNPYFYSAILKYGWDNFEHSILYSNLSSEEADEIEKRLIIKYNSTNRKYGYNNASGGKNKIPNNETRKKQSKSASLRPPVTKETKRKLSALNKNKKKSKEMREKFKKAALKREASKKYKKERPVKCINTGEIFKSCREAADWCGLVGTSGIALVCQNKKQKTAGVHPETKEKLKWSYV